MGNHKTTGYKVFTVFNILFLTVLSLLCIIPLVHVLAVSFSGRSAATANLVGLLPIDFTTDAYKKTIANPNFSRAFFNSVVRTLISLIVSTLITVMAAYSLARDKSQFKSRGIYIVFFMFCMLFDAGLVPFYMMVNNLKLINSIWALVLPGAVSIFNIILVLNYFRSNVPPQLEEAAMIDGANPFVILFKIFVPISMPVIATIMLFTIVGQWNSWFDGIIFISDPHKYPLATFLQTIIVSEDFTKLNLSAQEIENLSNQTIKMAQIFISTLPILMVYPFLQKYYVKGMVIGSVKG